MSAPLALAALPIAARATERRLEELLNELFKTFFTGDPHPSPLGDVTFPRAALFFNQTEIDAPADKQPQIHTVFGELKPQETWFCSDDLSAWAETLEAPASGVAYGRTAAGTIEESVHGKLVRTLTGTAIRWQASGADFVEQVWDGGSWQTVRTLAGVAALRWARSGSAYVEQTRTGTTWTTLRTVAVQDTIWDGTKVLVTAALRLHFWVRAVNSGSAGQRTDFACRTVADNLRELFERSETHVALALKGVRHFRLASGPTPLPTTGYQTRLLIASAQLRYFRPHQ